jgi:hypothetical protein
MDDVPGARMLLPIFDCTADLPVALGETRSATPKAEPTHGQGNGHTPAAADRPVRRLECPIARAEAGKAPGFAVQKKRRAGPWLQARPCRHNCEQPGSLPSDA